VFDLVWLKNLKHAYFMQKIKIILPILLLLAGAGFFVFAQKSDADARFVTTIIDTKTQKIDFYWKNKANLPFRSIQNLKTAVEKQGKKLIFAMNGGMYKPDHSPQGLYIENKKMLSPLDTTSGKGNFYLKPNGVFYLTNDNTPFICTSSDFRLTENIKYATQSGPMLLIDGKIHTAFKQGSVNLNIRNGVGILPDGKLLFALSKTAVNFYDFALFFKNSGCKNALYLDGFVSRMYLPAENWLQTDGDFGVMIGAVGD
jgi:uncharacterized protein YigE (DUF2233 family)